MKVRRRRLQVAQCGCSCGDGGGRALVSPIHTFLRSRINLLNLILPPRFSMIIASFFASPGTVPCSAEALLLRSWSVPGCGGDGAVVVCRQVSNASDGVKLLGLPVCLENLWCPKGRSQNTVPPHSETSMKPWWNCRFLGVPIGNLRLETCFPKRRACP